MLILKNPLLKFIFTYIYYNTYILNNNNYTHTISNLNSKYIKMNLKK